MANLTALDAASRTMPMAKKGFKKRLTAEARREMPGSEFALPGHGEGPGGHGAGAYPIDTEARARNALARGEQHANQSELATIKRKVHAKFPDIQIGGDKGDGKRRITYTHSRGGRG